MFALVSASLQSRIGIPGLNHYLPLRSGKWSYLASWQDKFTRRIVGWAVEERMTEDLIIKAFERALGSSSVCANTIVHTESRQPVCIEELSCATRS